MYIGFLLGTERKKKIANEDGVGGEEEEEPDEEEEEEEDERWNGQSALCTWIQSPALWEEALGLTLERTQDVLRGASKMKIGNQRRLTAGEEADDAGRRTRT